MGLLRFADVSKSRKVPSHGSQATLNQQRVHSCYSAVSDFRVSGSWVSDVGDPIVE